MAEKIMARDMSAPRKTIVVNGQEYTLAFDCNTLRICEDVYEDHYKRQKNFAEIADELARNRLGAIMAILYASLISGGADLSWQQYTEWFRLENLSSISESLVAGITEALPEARDTTTP